MSLNKSMVKHTFISLKENIQNCMKNIDLLLLLLLLLLCNFILLLSTVFYFIISLPLFSLFLSCSIANIVPLFMSLCLVVALFQVPS